MIYFFHGSDSAKVRAKAFQWIAAARAKAPDAAYVRLNATDITPSSLDEALSSQGLFFTRTLVLLDDPFSESESAEIVLDSLAKLAESENPVAILAPKLIATRVKKLEALAAKTFVVDATDKKPARGFNSALVNALAAKDGPALWKELMKAKREGYVPEMLHGLLHWKARDLMQKGDRDWTAREARELSVRLIELLSTSRSGELPLDLSLERFALSL